MADDSVAVWQQLSGLKGQDLIDWRLSSVRTEVSDTDRNLHTLPLPFGWFMVAYSDELEIGGVMPLHYFRQRTGPVAG